MLGLKFVGFNSEFNISGETFQGLNLGSLVLNSTAVLNILSVILKLQIIEVIS